MILGGLYLEELVHGGAYFRNFTVYDFYSGVQMSIIFVTKSVSWSINSIIAKMLQVSSCLNSSRVIRM